MKAISSQEVRVLLPFVINGKSPFYKAPIYEEIFQQKISCLYRAPCEEAIFLKH